MLLQTCALSADDESAPAAKVSASGSNRVKLHNGVASFRGVKVAADTPGPYLLRVEPLSRKVNVRQGTLLVQVGAGCACLLAWYCGWGCTTLCALCCGAVSECRHEVCQSIKT